LNNDSEVSNSARGFSVDVQGATSESMTWNRAANRPWRGVGAPAGAFAVE
jgi:hypothetical protein